MRAAIHREPGRAQYHGRFAGKDIPPLHTGRSRGRRMARHGNVRMNSALLRQERLHERERTEEWIECTGARLLETRRSHLEIADALRLVEDDTAAPLIAT
jgi:hypothetical protein